MRTKIILMLGVFLLVTMACSLPINLSNGGESTVIPSPLPGQPTFTATPAPYASVRLYLSDLPAGFSELSEEQLASYGLDIGEFADLFEQADLQARPQAMSSFRIQSGDQVTLVASLAAAPIPGLQQAMWDFFISHPDLILQALNTGVFSGVQASALPGMDQIGDHSAGFRLFSPEANAFQSDLGVVRRDDVVVFVIVLYRNTPNVNVNIIQLMQVLDSRILEIKAITSG